MLEASAWISVSHTSVTAVLLWTPVGSIVLFARAPGPVSKVTMPSTT